MIKKIIAIIASLGFIDATYLSIIKFTNNASLCMPGIGDCWTVNNSRFSEWNGIPISMFGIAAYFTIGIILFLESKSKFFEEYGPIFVLGVSLAGTLFSIYLTYLQIAVIKAICPFCIVSAITMTTVFILSIVRITKN